MNSDATRSALRGEQDHPIRRLRCCIVVTVDITILNLCRGRLEYLSERGFDVTVICAPTPHAAEIVGRGVRLSCAPLHRDFTPLRDLQAIWRLFRFFRRERFDIVEVSTPKAALVGSIATWLARAPHVVHLLRGLAYEGQRGVLRVLLKASQTIPCRLADEVISVSHSMMQQAIEDGICPAAKIRVLAGGSSNGVDLQRFRPHAAERDRMRRELQVPPDAIIAGFVGRITADKGIGELIGAFEEVAKQRPNLFLLLVGDYEKRDRPSLKVVESIKNHPQVRHVGWRIDTVPYYRAMDFLTLPTYREGFANVLLEAAAMGLPIVTTDIVGCRDAVVSGETAILVPPRNASALAQAMRRLTDDAALREQLGSAGRRRVESTFAQETVWRLQAEAFRSLIARKCKGAARQRIAP